MRYIITFILLGLIVSGCVPGASKVTVTGNKKEVQSSASVSSVRFINNQLVINGAGLVNVRNVKVSGHSLNEKFTIESQTATQIIANSIHGFSFDVSKVFNLILSDASASATFAIDFSLCQASLGSAGFDCTAPSNNDVLTYDTSTNKWIPKALTGLSYKGVWDANTVEPISTIVGQYYIVDTANLPNYKVGDWIVWNGSSYDIVAQSTAGGVATVFSRTGVIVATEGDYELDQLFDVDLTVAPTAGQVLKFNGTKWIADTDTAGGAGGAGSVTTTELADGSVTGTKIANTTITNANISAAAAIDYSKLNISAGAIPYAKLSIADGDIPYGKLSIADGAIPAAKITGLPASLPSGGTTAQYFAGDITLQTLNTAAVPESGTNYYFTDVRTRAATLTGLASASGSIIGTDTVLGAFGKLLGTQGDYVSKSANTTVLGSITIDNTVGELHVPTLPTVGADLTQAASAGYVQNFLGTFGQWIKTASDIVYTAGNVGIGTTTPTTSLSFGGNNSQVIGMEKHTVANSAGNGMTLRAGGATSGATDKAGGYLHLNGGISTGLGTSIIDFSTASPGVTGTANNSPTVKMTILGNGNVGIGTASPGNKLEVAGGITASSILITGNSNNFGWDNTVYTSTSSSLNTPPGTGASVTNAATADGTVSYFIGASRNTAGTNQKFYLGSLSSSTGYAPAIVFGQQTGATAYNERMRIDASGNIGIGTTNPEAALTVAGTIASTPPAPFAGAVVDLSKSNTQVLTNVGQTAITLSNMVHGGSYTLIIQDTTSRIYTFTGCTTSKFQPANMATIAATHTMYNIMTVYNGANYDCYITWSSGYN